jgi:hypothetical protein
MRFIYSILFVFIFLLSCSDNRILKKNNIYELKYFISFIEDKGDKQKFLHAYDFNRLYNCLNIMSLNDSSLVFTCNYYKSKDIRDEFLIHFIGDSMRIYRQEQGYGYTSHGMDIENYWIKTEKAVIENKFDTVQFIFGNKLRNCFTLKQSKNNSLNFKTLWESGDKKYFYYYQFTNCQTRFYPFIYEKTVKNSIINPLPKICNERNY